MREKDAGPAAPQRPTSCQYRHETPYFSLFAVANPQDPTVFHAFLCHGFNPPAPMTTAVCGQVGETIDSHSRRSHLGHAKNPTMAWAWGACGSFPLPFPPPDYGTFIVEKERRKTRDRKRHPPKYTIHTLYQLEEITNKPDVHGRNMQGQGARGDEEGITQFFCHTE